MSDGLFPPDPHAGPLFQSTKPDGPSIRVRIQADGTATPWPTACTHSGRVRPVVWAVAADGTETPNTVVCEQCWRVIGAGEPAHTSYAEDEDGWYVPVLSSPSEFDA